MLMPKQNRQDIYEYLFREGVIVAKHDYLQKHPALDIPNLHVIKTLQSLESRGYVKEQYAWRHHYWHLTNEGIQFLRDSLQLPADCLPATLVRRANVSERQGPSIGGRQLPSKPSGGEEGGEQQSTYRRETGDARFGGFGRSKPIPQ